MRCPHCNTLIDDDSDFCKECGERIKKAKKRICPNCQHNITEDSRFCHYCGAKIEPETEKSNENEAEKVDESINADDRFSSSSEPDFDYSDTATVKQITTSDNIVNFKKAQIVWNEPLYDEFTVKPKTRRKHTVLKVFTIIFAVLIGCIVLFVLLGKASSCLTNTANTSTAVKTESKISVPNVVGKTYSQAVKDLENCGFTNIISNVYEGTDESSWIVTKQSVTAGKKINASDRITLTCEKQCGLYLEITSQGNWFFSKYDIDISLDGKKIGTVKNGEEFTYNTDVLSGSHNLVFSKSEDNSFKTSKTIYVSEDMIFSCELEHNRNEINIVDDNSVNI